MKKINGHIVFIALILILSLFFLKSILHKDKILDNVHYINDLTFLSYNVKEALSSNQLALWTPYFYSGQPLLAIPENYMFDLNFLFIYLFRDIYLAMNLSAILYFFLAGLGMYFLVYNFIENKKAAFLSSLIYMFNGFMYSFVIGGHLNILEGYALTPFIFLFVHNALKGKDWVIYSMLAGILFALQVLSGSMILFFYSALIVGFYVAINLINKNFKGILIKSIFVGIIIIAVTLSLSAIKLLPVLEFTKISSRAVNVSFREFLGNPINIIDIPRILITNIGFSGFSAAIGIVGVILLLCSLSYYKKRIVVFSLILVIFSLLFASGSFISGIMYKIPGFDKLRHVERAMILFVFASSMLVAYGFVFLSEKLKNYQKYLRSENLLFAGIILLILAELLFLQNLPLSAKIVKTDEIKVLQHISNDKSLFRTMNLGLNEVIGHAGYNYYAQKGISEIKGGGGIWINDYVLFLSLMQQTLNSKVLGILNVKYIITDKKIEKEDIRYVDEFTACKDCAVYNAFGPYLYENKDFIPRFYIVPNAVLVVGNSQDVKKVVYSLMFQSLSSDNTVIIEGTAIKDYSQDFLNKFNVIILLSGSVDQNSIQKLKSYVSQGGTIAPDLLNGQTTLTNELLDSYFKKTNGSYVNVNVDEYLQNKVVIDMDNKEGWLVISERFAHFPGWKASLGKKNFEMFKADAVISALYLNGEKGKLVFEYKPESFRKGKIISIVAVVVIIIYLGYFVYRKIQQMKKFK